MDAQHVDTAAIFSPRGGSAQVIRYLLPTLEKSYGVHARLMVGSLGAAGALSHAGTFYRGIEVFPADYSEAVAAAAAGADPLAAAIPLHPSYEDRPGALDRVFCSVSPNLAANLVRFWTGHLSAHGVAHTDVLHLHHLTPVHEAAQTVRLGSATVTTLHGTELKMMANACRRVDVANRTGRSVAALAGALAAAPDAAALAMRLGRDHKLSGDDLALLGDGRWDHWRYAEFWLAKLREYATSSTRLVVVSDHDNAEAQRLLNRDEASLLQVSNGVDTEHFVPRDLTNEQRLDHFVTWLVKEPQGWRPNAAPGSIAYTVSDVARLRRANGSLRPIFLFVGRFLSFKRVPLLIRSFAKSREDLGVDAALIVWGGYPDEWEGEHPYDVAVDAGVTDDVYFIGWRGHDDLAVGLACADVMVAPALNEPFGLVYLEAMACRIPVIASASGGPLKFVVSNGPNANGWLVDTDDEAGLVATLAATAANADERRQRGNRAAAVVRERYSWSAIAALYKDVFDDALSAATSRK
jgi:D-inositol-3-phosphate glycosyltransferase